MENKPYNIQISDQQDKMIAHFSGNLVINYINEIVDIVKKEISFSKPLDLIIDNPESIDLTFIQLVLSIQKDSLENNQDLSVTANIKPELKSVIANAGFNQFFN
ncbi:hypothetical protein DMA11_02405 [Marinilabiliaceae bacterium JC017]|nr:hypothetical protein DMA11_02405 [Marinilabiliaceae bacterium JC017]